MINPLPRWIFRFLIAVAFASAMQSGPFAAPNDCRSYVPNKIDCKSYAEARCPIDVEPEPTNCLKCVDSACVNRVVDPNCQAQEAARKAASEVTKSNNHAKHDLCKTFANAMCERINQDIDRLCN